jgi:hypothetical protein
LALTSPWIWGRVVAPAGSLPGQGGRQGRRDGSKTGSASRPPATGGLSEEVPPTTWCPPHRIQAEVWTSSWRATAVASVIGRGSSVVSSLCGELMPVATLEDSRLIASACLQHMVDANAGRNYNLTGMRRRQSRRLAEPSARHWQLGQRRGSPRWQPFASASHRARQPLGSTSPPSPHTNSARLPAVLLVVRPRLPLP